MRLEAEMASRVQPRSLNIAAEAPRQPQPDDPLGPHECDQLRSVMDGLAQGAPGKPGLNVW